MNVALITSDFERIKVENHAIKMQSRSIPTSAVDLLILTSKIDINTSDLLRLSKENVAVLCASGSNHDFCLTLPLQSKNSDIKICQYEALRSRVGIARDILQRKFETHVEGLLEFGIETQTNEFFASLEHANTIEELLLIEGRFAKFYFDHFFSLFPKTLAKGLRSKRPPLDPVNAVMGYVYTFFYNFLTARLYTGGFEPSISYLHVPFRSHYALSSDLMEFFRAKINHLVWRFFDDKFLGVGDFTCKNGVYLKSETRGEVWKRIMQFAKESDPEIRQILAWLRKRIVSESAESRVSEINFIQ